MRHLARVYLLSIAVGSAVRAETSSELPSRSTWSAFIINEETVRH